MPNGWCFIKIKNIASLYTGDSINQDVKKSKYTNIEEGFNYIGTKDIGYDNQINYENGVKIPFNEPFKICPKGKVLLCIEGGNAGNKIAISEENVCFGNKLLCFNTFLFEDTFLFIYLQSTIFRNVFKSKETGLIGGVSIPKIGDCYIPIPSRNEQLKIVKIVKDFLNKINSINRLFVDIENLKLKIKSRIISLGVQGKLLNTDDNYYYEKNSKLNDLSTLINKGATPTTYGFKYKKYGINFIKVECLDSFKIRKEFITCFIDEKTNNFLNRSILETNDILCSIAGTLGKLALVNNTDLPANTNQAIAIIRPKHRIILAKFLLWFLQNYLNQKETLGHGCGMGNLTLQELRNIDIKYPESQEIQLKIAQNIETLLGVIESL